MRRVMLVVVRGVWNVSASIHSAKLSIYVSKDCLHGSRLALHCGHARVDASLEIGYAVARG